MRPLILLITMLVSLRPLAAQAPAAVPGDSLKVTARAIGMFDRPGALVSVVGDSLTFRDASSATQPVTIPLSAVDKLEVNFGNKPPTHAFVRGLLVGGGIGAAVGAIAGAVSYKPPPACQGPSFCIGLYGSQSDATIAGAAVGAVSGMLVGGILGATVIHKSNYRTVKPTTLGRVAAALRDGDLAIRPTFGAAVRAPGLAATIRF